MRNIKSLLVLALTILAAIALSSISHVRAQHSSLPYGIWFRKTGPAAHMSQEAVDRMSPEQRRIYKMGEVRDRFEGERGNGDHVQVFKPSDPSQESWILTFAQKGVYVHT